MISFTNLQEGTNGAESGYFGIRVVGIWDSLCYFLHFFMNLTTLVIKQIACGWGVRGMSRSLSSLVVNKPVTGLSLCLCSVESCQLSTAVVI